MANMHTPHIWNDASFRVLSLLQQGPSACFIVQAEFLFKERRRIYVIPTGAASNVGVKTPLLNTTAKHAYIAYRLHLTSPIFPPLQIPDRINMIHYGDTS
jgi:hypothetical protein